MGVKNIKLSIKKQNSILNHLLYSSLYKETHFTNVNSKTAEKIFLTFKSLIDSLHALHIRYLHSSITN